MTLVLWLASHDSGFITSIEWLTFHDAMSVTYISWLWFDNSRYVVHISWLRCVEFSSNLRCQCWDPFFSYKTTRFSVNIWGSDELNCYHWDCWTAHTEIIHLVAHQLWSIEDFSAQVCAYHDKPPGLFESCVCVHVCVCACVRVCVSYQLSEIEDGLFM